METALTPQQRFEEKMKDVIKDKIGELLPDDILAGIVQTGIKDAFFAPRKVTTGTGYDKRETIEEPWLITYLRKECREQVALAVQVWISNNPTAFKESVDKVLTADAGHMIVAAFSQMFQTPFNVMQQEMYQIMFKLKDKGIIT